MSTAKHLWFAFLAVVVAMVFPSALFASITVVSQTQLASDVQQDIEPAIVSQVRSGTEYTATVYMKFSNTIAADNAALRFATKNMSTGTIYSDWMPGITGTWAHYADPSLAVDTASDFYAQRMYAVGLGFNKDTSGNYTSSAIGLWYSDNGGTSWSSGDHFTNPSGSTDKLMDKPTVAVSPDTVNGTAGYVYVTYENNGGVYLYASWNGGITLNGPYQVAPSGFGLGAPHVMVDTNGDVYVSTKQNGALQLYRAAANTTPSSLSFSRVAYVSTASFPSHVDVGGGHYVRCETVPETRIDSAHHRVSYAWGEQDPNTLRQRVSFMSIDLANSYTVAGPTVIVSDTGNNFNVGMDVDGSGGYLIGYYSFPSGVNFYQGRTYVTVSGTTVTVAESPATISGTQTSDVSQYSTDGNGDYELGEFHDIAFGNSSFKVSGIIVRDSLNGYGNPWFFVLTRP